MRLVESEGINLFLRGGFWRLVFVNLSDITTFA